MSLTRSGRLILASLVVLSLIATAGWQEYRAHNVRLPLLCAAVGLAPDGSRECLAAAASQQLYAGTRVIRTADPRAAALVSEEQAWLASGTIPDLGPGDQGLLRSALLDLHVLTQSNGALVAGWPARWRYVWPRDASFAAVALAKTGHLADAAKILAFLQARQPADGVFQARYLPDGSGVPDARGEESDGTGWVLWAMDDITRDLDAQTRLTFLTPLRPLALTATQAALRLTDTHDGLPAPSLDYWEVRDKRLSLGTVAPLAAGLEAAPRLMTTLGEPQLAAQAQVRSATLNASVRHEFGRHGYGRYLGADQVDTSITFLLPPFTSSIAPDVMTSWRQAQQVMKRPAGGLAPGAGWKNDGISWTPETALFALTAAATGDTATARNRLTWLADHRTAEGALPEKVLSDGQPAGPAPLAWTDALVVLTAEALT